MAGQHMKKLVVILLSYFAAHSVFAADSANLKLNFTGATQNHYLCISNAYCINMAKISQKSVAMDPRTLKRIIMLNLATKRMYPQPLPSSCQVTVEKNQTLTISGKMMPDQSISQLKCAVS
jgi:hypothetical protein